MKETRFGVQGTLNAGVFFTESIIPRATTKRHIRVEISRQNANLHDIKGNLARAATRVGANAVQSFKYGQRSHRWWEYLTFKWDSEAWFGEGDAVYVLEQE